MQVKVVKPKNMSGFLHIFLGGKKAFQAGPVYIHRVQRTTATMLIIAAKQVSVFS